MSWATSGNATLPGQLRHQRTVRQNLERKGNELREVAALYARSDREIPPTISEQLRHVTRVHGRVGRGEGRLRHLLFELTGSAYLPEEEEPVQSVLPFPLNPGGSDGEGRSEEVCEVGGA